MIPADEHRGGGDVLITTVAEAKQLVFWHCWHSHREAHPSGLTRDTWILF